MLKHIFCQIENGYHFINNEDKIIKFMNSTNTSSNLSSTLSSSFNLNNSIASQCSSSNLNSIASRFIQNLNDNLVNFSFHSNSYYLKNGPNNKNSNDDILVTYKRIDSINNKYIKQSNTRLNECECQKIQFYFRVKFYVQDPLLLTSSQTRNLYYLQLKQNYLCFNYKITEEKYFELASLALVSDFGPYDPQVHSDKYFNLNLYFPSWIVYKLGSDYIYKNMPSLHAQNSHLTAISAQNKFIHELTKEDNPYNFHLYNLYKNKEETPGTIGLGIAPKGILIFDLRNSNEIRLISTFSWSSVTKINFHVIGSFFQLPN